VRSVMSPVTFESRAVVISGVQVRNIVLNL
jgi:hypothetical protein